MAPRWEPSADKHGVLRSSAVFAIASATLAADIGEGIRGGRLMLHIGPEHAQTDRELEVIVEVFATGREAVIFHVMPLGPKFRRFREENSHE